MALNYGTGLTWSEVPAGLVEYHSSPAPEQLLISVQKPQHRVSCLRALPKCTEAAGVGTLLQGTLLSSSFTSVGFEEVFGVDRMAACLSLPLLPLNSLLGSRHACRPGLNGGPLAVMRWKLGEQLRCLELQGELRRDLLQELAEFMRRRAEVELEYSRGLDKLAERFASRSGRLGGTSQEQQSFR